MTKRATRSRPAIGAWAWAAGAVVVGCLWSSAREEGAVADTATLARATKRLPIDREVPSKTETATFALG